MLDQEEQDKRARRSNIIFLCVSVVIFLIIIGLRLFVIYPIEIVESSMMPTYESGQLVLVSKLSKPDRGDVVIVQDKDGDILLIKRVVAIEGDSILLVIREDNLYYLKITTSSGQVIYEQYDNYQVVGIEYNLGNLSTDCAYEVHGLYLLGDNRNNSIDSRVKGDFDWQSVKGVVLTK
ncbi:MAG: signal peptidase I [Clostridia bacterium]|nr:signal peptidase I [Clostridia bacterium]